VVRSDSIHHFGGFTVLLSEFCTKGGVAPALRWGQDLAYVMQ
jgi:hypothetical protein